ncbi:MAG: class I SAM-dependent methyltransferase [Elusimicrobiota bacterium]
MKSDNKDIDWGLKFYHDVLGLESLHFGLWRDDELNLNGARKAQERYTEELLDLIPDKVNKVLDAGCGTGTTYSELKKRGYEVECLNPDKYQEKIFRQKIKDRVKFHEAKFEEFKVSYKYDLILMSESSQYMDTDKMINNAKKLLNPDGWLLIADYFRKKDISYYKTCKIKDIFIRKISDNGFILEKKRDITNQILPNLRLGRKLYEEYAVPVVKIIAGYLQAKNRFLSYVGKLIFSNRINKIKAYLFKHTPDKLDEHMFEKNMNYLFLLFKLEQ